MKNKLILTLLLLTLTTTVVYGLPYTVAKLYAFPNSESQIAFVVPTDIIKIDILQNDGEWLLIRAKWSVLAWHGETEGWVYIKQEMPEVVN